MGKRSKVSRLFLAPVLAFGLSGGGAFATEQSATQSACRLDQVELRGDWGQARFSIELADDEAERATGLMNREYMPKSAGMLFVYPEAKRVSFWMKNTLIPLDMIFIDSAGVVQKIHSNATPHDTTPILGGDGIKAVLEINGGLSRLMGIKPGSHIRHPAFANTSAAWPC
ncbi:DUF192 domain-containing protein [Roseovarius aestuarii]|nr:DUF192 domain-containing protein [Roseovarius aestuarii]